MKLHCLVCGSHNVDNRLARYLALPSHIIVPNQYYLCEEHKDKWFEYEDIYNEDGTRK